MSTFFSWKDTKLHKCITLFSNECKTSSCSAIGTLEHKNEEIFEDISPILSIKTFLAANYIAKNEYLGNGIINRLTFKD
jgi:hypothetical protein